MSCCLDASLFHCPHVLSSSSFTIKCATLNLRQLHRCVTAYQRVGVRDPAASWLIFSGGELVTDTSLLQRKKRNNTGWSTKPWSYAGGKGNKFALKLHFLSLESLKRVQSCRNPPAAAAAASRWWRELHHSPRLGHLAGPPYAPHLAPGLTHDAAPCQREHMWWRGMLFLLFFFFISEREREKEEKTVKDKVI